MKHFHKLLIVAPMSFLALVGCSQAEQASKEVENAAKPAANVATSTVQKAAGEGINGLLGAVAKTKAAVKSGDFETAKKEFASFEETWKTAQAGVKTASGDKYDTIVKKVDEIKGLMKESKPNQDQLLSALQSLTKNLKPGAKS
ncbi:MAG: DUF4363 domain-containing protein [Calothrix sp. MO_167.B42]|nr:DUF4363 domain-containing protein [Calothrix sp. MO_167.B42]